MPRQQAIAITNNFNKGLITEASGLNYPENACVDTYNCTFDYLGTASRRLGIDYESNFTQTTVDRTNQAITTYIWNNVGGDGNTRLFVVQIGPNLYYYNISAATTATPLSGQKLITTTSIDTLVADGGTFSESKECSFADCICYLFVFHPDCDPCYVSYSAGTTSVGR